MILKRKKFSNSVSADLTELEIFFRSASREIF